MKSSQVVRKIYISLALTFMLPLLVFLYVLDGHSEKSSIFMVASTIVLAGIGFLLIRDVVQSIRYVFSNIEEITNNELPLLTLDTNDALKSAGHSIDFISKKLVEDREDLQHSTRVIEEIKEEHHSTQLYLDSVMQVMKDGLLVVDTDFKIRRLNQAGKTLLNFEDDTLIGRTIDAIFENLRETDFSETGSITGKQMTCLTIDNQKIPVDVNIEPFVDHSGTRKGYIFVLHDMRAQLKWAARLERAKRRAAKQMESAPLQAANANSDLRTPPTAPKREKTEQLEGTTNLSSIATLTAGIGRKMEPPLQEANAEIHGLHKDLEHLQSYLQVLEYGIETVSMEQDSARLRQEIEELTRMRGRVQSGSSFSRLNKHVLQAQSALKHIHQVLKSLRQLSRFDGDLMRECDVNRELDNTLSHLSRKCDNKIDFVKTFSFLPPLFCYPHQLNEVFKNLLLNATEAVGQTGTVTLQTAAVGGTLFITVEDTGPGIKEEVLGQVFSPFYSTKKPEAGRGLGLYWSLGIIEKHGGTLTVESKVGYGTRFTIQLPVMISDVESQPELTIRSQDLESDSETTQISYEAQQVYNTKTKVYRQPHQ